MTFKRMDGLEFLFLEGLITKILVERVGNGEKWTISKISKHGIKNKVMGI